MDKPKRKNLRLPDYDYTENGKYYITICTHEQRHLFASINPNTGTIYYNDAGKMVLHWLRKVEEKYCGVTVDCSILMPNHLHFILFLQNSSYPIGQIIGWFKSQSTNEYIRGVKSGRFPSFDKAIWQRNYYEHIIRSEKELQSIRQYITFNSLKWNVLRE